MRGSHLRDVLLQISGVLGVPGFRCFEDSGGLRQGFQGFRIDMFGLRLQTEG